MATLYELTKTQRDIEAALTENGGELTPELETLWAETAETLPEKVDGYNAVLRNLNAQASACGDEIKRLQALKKTCDNSVKRIKEHVATCMQEFGFDKLDGGVCRFSLRKTQAIDVDDEQALAPYADATAAFIASLPPYVKVSLSIDKTAVKEYTKDTPDVMPIGCQRVTNTSLIIK